MLCGVRRWVGRHKKALGATAVAAGVGTYCAYRWVNSYFEDLQQQHEGTMRELQKSRFFQSIAYGGPVLAELPSLKEAFEEEISLPSAEEVKERTATLSKEEKLAFWNEMNVLNFTRLCTAAYAVTLLTVTLRIHMTIVARFLYLLEANDMSSRFSDLELTNETRLAFLNKARYIAHTGVQHLRNTVQRSCEQCLSRYPVTQACSLKDVHDIILAIRENVEGSVGEFLLSEYMLEPEDAKEEDQHLRLLLNETRELFESIEFEDAVSSCLTNAFRAVELEFASFFAGTLPQYHTEEQLAAASFHLIKMQRMLKEITAVLLDGEDGNCVLEAVTASVPLDNLARMVYNVSL